MSVLLFRIDDRLIHGVVVQGWVKALEIQHIIVSDDRVAGDQMQKTLLAMATPSSLKLSIFTIDESVKKLKTNELKDENVLVLVSNPSAALRLVEKGVIPGSINVGGMHFTPGKKQILKSISVNEKDIEAFKEINSKGIKLDVRIIPSDTSVDMMKCIEQ
ncbi:MAG: PTS sugar transporter subunit IIB [bacterium]